MNLTPKMHTEFAKSQHFLMFISLHEYFIIPRHKLTNNFNSFTLKKKE